MSRRRYKLHFDWPKFEEPPFPPERYEGETEKFVLEALALNDHPPSLPFLAMVVMQRSSIHATQLATGEIRRRVARVLRDLERRGEAHRLTGEDGVWRWKRGKAGAFDV